MQTPGASSVILTLQLFFAAFAASLPSILVPNAVPVAVEFGIDHNPTLPLNITTTTTLK